MELLDNGWVRYYELPDPHETIPPLGGPKHTLRIFRARIIDVMTLRDVHVGLPHGMYGFVFNAQRLPSSLQRQQQQQQQQRQQHQQHGQQHEQQQQPKQQQQQQQSPQQQPQQYSGMHTITSPLNENPLDLPDCQQHGIVQPRDYLCAVSTLEEAQAWVVALQWAAQQGHDGWYDDADDELFSNAKMPALEVISTPPQSPPPQKRLTIQARPTHKKPKKKRALAMDGRILVPRLQRLGYVRTTMLTWTLAFRVQLLIVTKSGTLGEERTILRTHPQIEGLLEKLDSMNSSSSKIQSLVKNQRAKLSRPRLRSYRDYVTLLPGVDSILRTLSMDPSVCNSDALKAFWCLDDYREQSTPFLQIHVANSVASLGNNQQIPTGTTETYVKQWLAAGTTETTSFQQECLFWVLSKNQAVVWGAFILPLVLLRPLWMLHNNIWTVQIKVDVLIGSWILLYCLGRIAPDPARQKDASSRVSTDVEIVDGDDDCLSVVEVRSASTDEGEGPDDDDDDEDDGLLLDLSDVTESRSTTITTAMTNQRNQRKKGKPDKKTLSSPLPQYPANGGVSCWSKPNDEIFRVRSLTYLQDRVKLPSGPAPFSCRGVDIWLTDNPERHIARHPAVLGGKLQEEDTFLVNFLLPFGNLVAYFGIPPLDQFPPKLARVWTKFLRGDQQYRDARLKLLPVVVEGPWIVKAAVGPGTSPALLGKVIPLQYYFRSPTLTEKGVYEVDVIITASSIAKGILSVVKGHTKSLSIAFGFIIEAAEEEELPETVLCNFQLHALHLEDCPQLPKCNLDQVGGL